MDAAPKFSVVIAATERSARRTLTSALEQVPGVVVATEAPDLKEAAVRAARLHPDAVILALSPGEKAGADLPLLLRAAPWAAVVVTLLEEWSEEPAGEGPDADLRKTIEVLRQARAVREGGTPHRDETFAILAHDILTPTTAVIGVAEVLLRYWGRFKEKQRREAVQNIARLGRDLAGLVHGIVRAAAAESGSLVADRQPTDVRRLLREAHEAVLHVADDHRLVIEVPEEMPEVWVDRARVREAITNLLVNAVKYSPPNTTVRLAAAPEADEVRITVSDEGPGISSEDRRRLFKKFTRIRPHEGSGHGLGLYLAKAIAEAHGGRVWVESEVGEGSTFGVALPATGRTRGGERVTSART